MTSLPPHGSLRRRSVLRALGVAASRAWIPGLWLAGVATGQPAQASVGDLTGFEVIRDEDGVFLGYAVNFELGKGPEDALEIDRIAEEDAVFVADDLEAGELPLGRPCRLAGGAGEPEAGKPGA